MVSGSIGPRSKTMKRSRNAAKEKLSKLKDLQIVVKVDWSEIAMETCKRLVGKYKNILIAVMANEGGFKK